MYLLFFLACTPKAPADSAGDTNGTTDTAPTDSSGDTADSTGDSGTTDGVSPVLTDLRLEFHEIPNIGMTIHAEVDYTDPQDDLVDGFLYLTFDDGEAPKEFTLQIVRPQDADVTQQQAISEVDGSFYFGLTPADTTRTYALTVQAEDLAGNLSNTLTEILEGE